MKIKSYILAFAANISEDAIYKIAFLEMQKDRLVVQSGEEIKQTAVYQFLELNIAIQELKLDVAQSVAKLFTN